MTTSPRAQAFAIDIIVTLAQRCDDVAATAGADRRELEAVAADIVEHALVRERRQALIFAAGQVARTADDADHDKWRSLALELRRRADGEP